MEQSERNLYIEVTKKKTLNSQLIISIEENVELVQAITKYMREEERQYEKSLLLEKLLEEVADVEIMCGQLRVSFSADKTIDDFKLKKLERLKNRLSNLKPLEDKK